MNKEFLQALEAVSVDKGIDKELLIEAIETALLSAYKREFNHTNEVRGLVNRKTGQTGSFEAAQKLPDITYYNFKLNDEELIKDVKESGLKMSVGFDGHILFDYDIDRVKNACENTTIEGASSVILNVIGGKDLSLDEVVVAADLVKGIIDYSANVIFGACIDESMSDEVEVVIIATGFNNNQPTGNMDRATAQQKASDLSKRIDYAYYDRMRGSAEPVATPSPFGYPTAPQNNDMNAQYQGGMYGTLPPYVPNGYQTQANPYNAPYAPTQQMPYPAPAPYPMTPPPYEQTPAESYPIPPQPMSFEPDDPIPDVATPRSDATDRKHRPRFVDFFMKKNADEENDHQ